MQRGLANGFSFPAALASDFYYPVVESPRNQMFVLTLVRSSDASEGFGLCVILAIIGLVVDLRYQEKGGVRPTKKDKLYFLVAVGLCAAVVVVVAALGGDAGGLTVYLAVFLFVLWELGRWRVRRNNPLRKINQANQTPEQTSKP